jgi:hypothetical protein
MLMRRSLVVAGGTAAVLAAMSVSPSAARVQARKVVIRIDVSGSPAGGNPSGGSGTFTLHSGATTERGTESYSFFDSLRKGNITLTGRRGGLVLRTTSRPSGLSVDSQGLDLWTGTWRIASGTGAYAGAHGVGAYVGIIGPNYRVTLHLEGFRT